MATFKKRVSAPENGNKYYIHYTKGGYNPCLVIDANKGTVMPNCVGYSNGRLQELNGKTKTDWRIPAGNPKEWLAYAKKNGLKTGTTPKLGAVIVWEGHVANIESIASNGDITVSQSHYKGTNFDTLVLTKSTNYVYYGQKVLGYVYPDNDYGTGSYNGTSSNVTTEGKYKVQSGCYSVKANAKNTQTALAQNGFASKCLFDGKNYRIKTGEFADKNEADKLVTRLKSKGFGAFVTTNIAGKEVKL